jgi:hypothetical protein
MITHLTVTGYPASTALVIDMAKEIREQRCRLKASELIGSVHLVHLVKQIRFGWFWFVLWR